MKTSEYKWSDLTKLHRAEMMRIKEQAGPAVRISDCGWSLLVTNNGAQLLTSYHHSNTPGQTHGIRTVL